MEYQGIRYNVIQGIERRAWRWTVTMDGMLVTGQAETRSDAIAAAKGLSTRPSRRRNAKNHRNYTQRSELRDQLNPKLSPRQIGARILFSCAVTALAVVGVFFTIRLLAR